MMPDFIVFVSAIILVIFGLTILHHGFSSYNLDGVLIGSGLTICSILLFVWLVIAINVKSGNKTYMDVVTIPEAGFQIAYDQDDLINLTKELGKTTKLKRIVKTNYGQTWSCGIYILTNKRTYTEE